MKTFHVQLVFSDGNRSIVKNHTVQAIAPSVLRLHVDGLIYAHEYDNPKWSYIAGQFQEIKDTIDVDSLLTLPA